MQIPHTHSTAHSIAHSIVIRLLAVRSLLTALGSVLDLSIRLYVAQVFFLSGLTKIQNWDTTISLFQDEYRVPLLPPELAAAFGTAGELLLPVFLALGLGTRFAALGLTGVNIMAVVSYYHVLKDLEPALAQHMYWGLLLLVTLFHGPGKLSLDALIWPRIAGPSART